VSPPQTVNRRILAALTGGGGGCEGGGAGQAAAPGWPGANRTHPCGRAAGPPAGAVLEVTRRACTHAVAVVRGIPDTSAEGKRCRSRRFRRAGHRDGAIGSHSTARPERSCSRPAPGDAVGRPWWPAGVLVGGPPVSGDPALGRDSGCVTLRSPRWLLHEPIRLAAWLRGCREAASWPESVGAVGGGGVMLVWARESGSGCEWPGASG